MRGTPISLGKYYRPKACFTDKEHEVPFKAKAPMKLGNSVCTSTSRDPGKQCIQEMFNLMACLKNHEFEQANCLKELRIFNECSGTQKPVEFRTVAKTIKKSKVVEPGQTNMTTLQLNEYLKKFPT